MEEKNVALFFSLLFQTKTQLDDSDDARAGGVRLYSIGDSNAVDFELRIKLFEINRKKNIKGSSLEILLHSFRKFGPWLFYSAQQKANVDVNITSALP